ncbi:hypothetical protein LIER_38751 [Lithospermum erythrorhizon]|uniref:Reverse transcriptase domain-containing protein n=1 Tax=Lithospermum erythrorhizon TaxID=34254 RepID=A0AAV3Q8F3_LITER
MKNILEIQDSGNNLITNEEDIRAHCRNIYMDLFNPVSPSSPTGESQSFCDSLKHIPKKLTADQIACLTAPFQPEEVKIALFQMPHYKSLRPDGFLAEFYQKNWDIIGEDVTRATLEFLNSGHILKEINNSFITLIPKVDNPTSMTDYRLISLYNVIYKISSKVLVNRLNPHMNSLISPFQNGFVHGRSIQDNIIMAQELTYTIRTSKCKKNGMEAIKIDMSKAYDRINWDFVLKLLDKVGFPPYWIKLINDCVTTVMYSIIVNGQVSDTSSQIVGSDKVTSFPPFVLLSARKLSLRPSNIIKTKTTLKE